MAGVALVTRQIDRTVDIDRQVGVDLDQTAEVALIPVVAAPRLVSHVLDGEALTDGQLDVFQRPPPALGDGRLEHLVEPVRGNDEVVAERRIPVGKRALPRERPCEPGQRLLEVRLGMAGRDRVVERAGLIVERERPPVQHPHACA